MDTKYIIFSASLAILLPVLALAGIFTGGLQSQSPASSPFEAAVSAAPTQQSTGSEAQRQNGEEQSKNDNADKPGNVGGSAAQPLAQDTGQKLPSQDWKNFLSQYNSAPANLPVSSIMMSSNSLFMRGVQAPDLFPIRNWQVPFQDIDGEAVLAVELPSNKILYQKDAFTARPIASISKLVSALVIVNSMAFDEHITVSQKAIDTTGAEGKLAVSESLSVGQLLHAMLLESSNDAVAALQEHYDKNNAGDGITFVSAMNQAAHDLGLSSAFFEDPSGLSENNAASAADVATLMFEAYKNETIRSILALPIYDTVSKDGIAHHWVNTNSLLGAIPGVVAGKTGYTDEAGECMVIVTKVTNDKSVVTVVLGSTNRIQATTSLVAWVKDAYYWQ